MTIYRVAFRKSTLSLAVGASLMTTGLPGFAADFGLADGKFSVTAGGAVPYGPITINVDAEGLADDIPDIPTTLPTKNLGIPTFNLELVASDDTPATYEFGIDIVIDDLNSRRQLEASLGTFELSVNGSSITGKFPSGNDLEFFGRTAGGGINVTAKVVNNPLLGVVSFSNGTISFNAQKALDELVDNRPEWETLILPEFTDNPSDFQYWLIFEPIGGAGIGIESAGVVTPFDLKSGADVANLFVSNITPPASAYIIKGTFSTVAPPAPPGGGGGPVVPPPTPPIVEQVENILDDIIIPPEGEIDDETLANVGDAAEAATALGQQAASGIANGTVTTSQGLDVLTTISRVSQVTAQAAAATSDPTKAGEAAEQGSNTVDSFASVIGALDDALQQGSQTLTETERDTVQAAVVRTVLSGVQLLANAPSDAVKTAILQDLGSILTASINLGVPLTKEQLDAVLDMTDNAPTGSDVDDNLGNSVGIAPRPLISRDNLVSALQNAGLSTTQADHILEQLRKAINPEDVAVGGNSAANTLLSALLSALDGTPGGAGYDPDTGTTVVSIGGDSGSAEQLARINPTPRDIPARAISANVVSSSFPDGLRVTANGSVVLTANRVATVMVPASYDPINFFGDLASQGTVTTNDTGSIAIVRRAFPFSYHFSGTFDYHGVIYGGEPVARTTLTTPASGDESDLDYVFTVTYRDGAQQRMQPYVAHPDFVPSVRARGIAITTNRNTGVVSVNGRKFRPSYFVEGHSSAALAFWNDKADSFGIAYRALDVNGDGVMDYEIITEDGVQVAYGLPQ